jgi:hypothetical protein
MHGNIDVAINECLLNCLRKDTPRANLLDRAQAIDVTVRGDLDELDRVPQPSQLTGHPVRLPPRELTAPRSQSNRSPALCCGCHYDPAVLGACVEIR